MDCVSNRNSPYSPFTVNSVTVILLSPYRGEESTAVFWGDDVMHILQRLRRQEIGKQTCQSKDAHARRHWMGRAALGLRQSHRALRTQAPPSSHPIECSHRHPPRALPTAGGKSKARIHLWGNQSSRRPHVETSLWQVDDCLELALPICAP